jgi:hypothetical protein
VRARTKALSAAVAAAAGTALAVSVVGAPSADVTTTTFKPVADAQVREATPTTPRPTGQLRTDGGSGVRVQSVLKFDVAATGPITSAVLTLHATSVTADGPGLYRIDNAWDEATVTWNNRPLTSGAALGDAGAISTGQNVSYDVKSAVTGPGTYSFKAYQNGTDGVDFNSRESAVDPPTLTVTTEGTPTTTTTTTTTPPPTGSLCDQLHFTGCAVVAADPMTSNDVFVPGWSYVTDGYFLTSTQANWSDSVDQQINTFATGGDPAPGFDGQAHTGYRTLTTVGPTSKWDAANQACHTRAQIGGFGTNDRLYTFRGGSRYLLSASVRLEATPAARLKPAASSGAGNRALALQFKSVDSGINGTPTPVIDEASDGFAFNTHVNGVRTLKPVPAPRGTWVRLLLDIYFSNSSSGAYRLWIDTTGGAARAYTPVTGKVSGATLQSGYANAAFNTGPYHRLPNCGGFDGPDKHGFDLGNFEVVQHAVSDPW